MKSKASAGTLLFIAALIATFFMLSLIELHAEDEPSTADSETIISGAVLTGRDKVFVCYAAMAAVGISCMASSFALAKIGSAALGAMSEKLEIGGRAIVFLGLAEGIAIYGLIVAILMLNKI